MVRFIAAIALSLVVQGVGAVDRCPLELRDPELQLAETAMWELEAKGGGGVEIVEVVRMPAAFADAFDIEDLEECVSRWVLPTGSRWRLAISVTTAEGFRWTLRLCDSLGLRCEKITNDPETDWLQAMAQELVEETAVSGLSIAWARPGQRPRVVSSGVRSGDNESALDPDDLLNIGSIARSMTATALVEIVEREEYHWEANFGDLLAGKRWAELVEVEVFDPLALDSCEFDWTENDAPTSRGFEEDRLDGFMQPGRIHCSAADLARYGLAHLADLKGKDAFLKATEIAQLHRVDDESDSSRGWRVEPTSGRQRHDGSGSDGAFHAYLHIDPESEIVIAIIADTAFPSLPAAAERAAESIFERYGR